MNAQIRPASAGRAYDASPQLTETGSRTWITRGANFVIAMSAVEPGAVLSRADNPDEYMVLLGDVAATIRAGGETIEAAPESLTIVPPGPSEVMAKGEGRLVRVLSNRAADLLAKAENAAVYADGAAEVAPLVAWPDPPGGFKLRNYRPFDYDKPDTNMRLFRCTNLMINVLTKRAAPRDVKSSARIRTTISSRPRCCSRATISTIFAILGCRICRNGVPTITWRSAARR
jgi:hypothetical protein